MIRFAKKEMSNFLGFLNCEYPTNKDVFISVMHDYDCLDIGNDRVYAAYKHTGKVPVIIVAGEAPADVNMPWILEHHIAHEYCHHRQWCNNQSFDENEAEEFAQKAVASWISYQEIPNVEP